MRLAFAAIAAFRTRAKGGVIPQARHGGNGKLSVAMLGSKLDGTGFEKEQMGHTHVPTTAGSVAEDTAGARNGLVDREVGEDAEVTLENRGDCGTPVLLILPKPRLRRFGYNVILGEDLRKPAWTLMISIVLAKGRNCFEPELHVFRRFSDRSPTNWPEDLSRPHNKPDGKSDTHILSGSWRSCIF
jgi:hypothetical protein